MLDVRIILKRGFKKTLSKLQNFFKTGPQRLLDSVDNRIHEGLVREKVRIKNQLLNASLGLAPLKQSTISYKQKLVMAGLSNTDPKIPLVRFKEIYENIDVIKIHGGNHMLFVRDSTYSHKDTPKRRTSRTVSDIVLIHKSGKLGSSGNVKRDIFSSTQKMEIRNRMIEVVTNEIKRFMKGDL